VVVVWDCVDLLCAEVIVDITNPHFIGMESCFEGKQKFDESKNKQ
jgi:hypothetical protein